MAGPAMNKVLMSLALPLLLAGCNMNGGGNGSESDAKGELVGARIGAPFTLVDQNGKTVRWDDFRGQYALVYFGYSYCPDVCPVDLQHIMQAFARLEKDKPAIAAKIQPIFITIDPRRDTPAVLKTYVSAFHPRLIGLTGTPEQIAKVEKDFAIYAVERKEVGASDYLMDHSRTPYLFGPDGKPIALVPVDDPATDGKQEGDAPQILAFLEKWVR